MELMWALTVDWVRYRASAAFVKLEYSAVVTKASSCFRLISNILFITPFAVTIQEFYDILLI